MRYLLGPLLALLLATPAHAVQITQVALNCAGDRLPAGVTVHTLTCMGQGLWLGATVGGFPVETDPTIRFALTVNGVELGSLLHTLPAHRVLNTPLPVSPATTPENWAFSPEDALTNSFFRLLLARKPALKV